jgi:hypothetical protein
LNHLRDPGFLVLLAQEICPGPQLLLWLGENGPRPTKRSAPIEFGGSAAAEPMGSPCRATRNEREPVTQATRSENLSKRVAEKFAMIQILQPNPKRK